jgi:hypothetical protein
MPDHNPLPVNPFDHNQRRPIYLLNAPSHQFIPSSKATLKVSIPKIGSNTIRMSGLNKNPLASSLDKLV